MGHEYIELFKRYINHATSKPFFINREGGTDCRLVLRWYQNKSYHPKNIMLLCGYYDKTKNLQQKQENLDKFCENYIESIKNSDIVMSAGINHVKLVQKNKLIQDFYGSNNFINFDFIKDVDSEHNFLLDCYKFLENKKILIVSSFANLMKSQYETVKTELFKPFIKINIKYKHFKYPVFKKLETVNTNITYNDGIHLEHCPHNNYHETVAYYKDLIRKTDFDIALLSCGGYTNEIGYFIKNELHRSAIYFGGPLQLYFGIRGARYKHLEKLINVNLEDFGWVSPKKSDNHHNLINLQAPERDGMNAYFNF
jgi:hypothetical protein